MENTDKNKKRSKKEHEQEPYFIEVDRTPCSHCKKGETWTVVGPDGYGCGMIWEDKEGAEEYAENMNEAYWQGRGAEPTEMP